MTPGRCPDASADARARWLWHLLSQPCPRALLHAAAGDLMRAIEAEPAGPPIHGADPTADPLPAQKGRRR